MSAELLSAISYILVSIFTPGPSNITSASMGVLYGFRSTLTFLIGLSAGFFLVVILSSWVSSTVLGSFPILQPILRYLGAAYILYLAFNLLKENYNFKETPVRPLGFGHGILLQILNPKLIFFAFSLFSAVLPPLIKSAAELFVVITLLTVTSFCATTVWTLFGAALKSYIRFPRIKTALNVILSLLLVFTAFHLAGIF